jgi:hypothetical protein
MTPREHANQLLEEWKLCSKAKPKNNAIDIQLDKDVLAPWAAHLARHLEWYDSESALQKVCYQFEPRLKLLKEKIVLEVLKNGSV